MVVVEPARPEPGYWAGAPSALVTGADTWLAYRERDPERRGGRVVLAHAHAGRPFDPVVVLDQERFGAESLERPALTLTGDGRWRLYVSCATPGSKHWRIELLEAAAPERLGEAAARTVLPGDELTAVKDPVIRFAARARDARPDERDALWNLMTSVGPDLARYRRESGREVPIVILERTV